MDWLVRQITDCIWRDTIDQSLFCIHQHDVLIGKYERALLLLDNSTLSLTFDSLSHLLLERLCTLLGLLH